MKIKKLDICVILAEYRLHKSNLSKKIDEHVIELQTWVKANEYRAKYKGNLKYIKFYILKLKLKIFFIGFWACSSVVERFVDIEGHKFNFIMPTKYSILGIIIYLHVK